jgi:hypothetical protein
MFCTITEPLPPNMSKISVIVLEIKQIESMSYLIVMTVRRCGMEGGGARVLRSIMLSGKRWYFPILLGNLGIQSIPVFDK